MATKTLPSSAPNPLSGEAIHRIGNLLEHIATACNEVDSLAYRFQATVADADAAESLIRVMREIACRCGWMADLGLQQMGLPTCVGSAEEWLLPPSYAWTPGTPHKARHDGER